jgi:hypothetical protein
MCVVGYKLITPVGISQERFDSLVLKIKEGFKKIDIDFDDVLVSGYVKRSFCGGFLDVLEFVKVIE